MSDELKPVALAANEGVVFLSERVVVVKDRLFTATGLLDTAIDTGEVSSLAHPPSTVPERFNLNTGRSLSTTTLCPVSNVLCRLARIWLITRIGKLIVFGSPVF
jgi:hypothetical protein